MTISPESKQELAEHSGDGYITCNIGDEKHVVVISQEEKACFDGVLNRVDQTGKPKTCIVGMLQRRGFNCGHGLVFLSITLVCLVIAMVGFFMSVAIGVQSAVSKHTTPDASTMVARALLDSSVTPFGTASGTASEANISTTCATDSTATDSTVTKTSFATVTMTISTTTSTTGAGTSSSSTSEEGDFSSTETVTLASETSTAVVTASATESSPSASSSVSSMSAESTADGVSGSLSSTNAESTCGGGTIMTVTYTVVPVTSSPSSAIITSSTSTATITVPTTEVVTLTTVTSSTISTSPLVISSATSPLSSGVASWETSSTTASETATIFTTVSSTAILSVTLETTAQISTAFVTTTVVTSASISSVSTPSSISLSAYSILSTTATVAVTSLTTVTQSTATTVTIGGSISAEEFSTTSLLNTPIGQSSSSALATAWNSTLVTTVGPTASGQGGNATWGGSGYPMPRPTSTGAVPVSAGSKGGRLDEDGWDVLRYIPMLAVGLLFV
ncbi:hypothetical protein CONLIGDRAFT_628283 [Coniochaeta ligniaria NRRL 30616]|uniref:Uncharacterized protein n=1 Tax=Coniochaeta ligniaria NRRL 30616 TaxID=1408157 RepID=A0A1J7JVH9_9PEZI|nr:hypothetical protein CONLIGDRAFT_628283 [Coniochaeta ligniaria NRRL 30616]